MVSRVFSGVEVFVTKHLSISIAVLGLLLFTGSARADEISDGTDAYNHGDYAEAVKLFCPAAEQGNASAQDGLGSMYFNGTGVLENYAEAVKWTRLSAEQGDEIALGRLGAMYFTGTGVIQNDVIAHFLFNLSAAKGNEDAVEARSIATERMTSNDISKAQEIARVCLVKNYKGCGF